MLPFLCPLSRWGNISAAEFARRFRDPFLRRAIPQMFSWESIPVMVGMSLLAYMHTKNAGFPLGGSLQFAEKIADRYLELGGEIHYESQVEKILVENKKAIGIRLYNNEEYKADRVISACDGHNTLFSLLVGVASLRRHTLRERNENRFTKQRNCKNPEFSSIFWSDSIPVLSPILSLWMWLLPSPTNVILVIGRDRVVVGC
jgi:hypothetical protein